MERLIINRFSSILRSKDNVVLAHPFRMCHAVCLVSHLHLHSFTCADQPLHHVILGSVPLKLHRAVLLHDLVYLHPAVIGLLLFGYV